MTAQEEKTLVKAPTHSVESPDRLPADLRSDIRARAERFAQALEERHVDVALITEPENIRYLTGFETLGWFTPTAALVRKDGTTSLFVRDFETPNVASTAVDAEAIGYDDNANPVQVLYSNLPHGSAVAWDFGYAAWTQRDLFWLHSALGRTPQDVGLIINRMRMVKSAAEIKYLREAARTTKAAMQTASIFAHRATWEREIVAEAYKALVLAGSSYPSSPIYAVSGPRSALPHVTWKPNAPVDRTVIYLEMGGSVERYTAPLMSTGLGRGSAPRLRQFAEVVEQMLHTAIDAVGPGNSAGSVDRVARRVAIDAGVSDEFRHRIGYSVGTSFPPGWGEPHVLALRSEEVTELQPGMVFHLVPHLVDQQFGAVGTSATVAVTTDGREILTRADPAIFEI